MASDGDGAHDGEHEPVHVHVHVHVRDGPMGETDVVGDGVDH